MSVFFVGTFSKRRFVRSAQLFPTSLTVSVGGNAVNTAIVSAYTITYNLSDSSGHEATEVTRSVTIEETLGLDPNEINSVSKYPNPKASVWTIESSRVINTSHFLTY
ncbi:DUF5011 domain-containing protein [Flavobacteriaceae bacterium]|nr:DUF5011 domain-containing protein [Flavobacteriaceae bacterium]